MKGIFINCKDTDFIARILYANKIFETRSKNTLKAFVGQRVALIETGKGRQIVRGYATIANSICMNYDEFRLFNRHHMVDYGSKYYCKKGGYKWLYRLVDIEPCSPIVLPPYNGNSRVYREISDNRL